MITLEGIPAVVIPDSSPAETSYLVATECPVIFTFQKKDASILSVTDSGNATINHDMGVIGVNGGEILVYDMQLDKMVKLTIVSTVNGSVTVARSFELRLNSDWKYIISPIDTPNAYLEIRLKINGVYEETTRRFSPSPNGVIEADISSSLQSKIKMDKVGAYVNVSDVEVNQSGKFQLEYRERFDGDTNAFTVEPHTWYYAYAVRSKEQGCNLWEYWNGKFFNLFDKPTYWLGTPFDVQFFWKPTKNSITFERKNYDASGGLLSTKTDVLNNAGKGYLNSVKVDEAQVQAICDYIDIKLT